MRVLLFIPPTTQLNAPYPSTAYLTGFLRHHGLDVMQVDASLELALRLFSRDGLRSLATVIKPSTKRKAQGVSRPVRFFLDHFDSYDRAIESTIRFLQGLDPSVAYRINSREFLPEGGRFEGLHRMEQDDPEILEMAFGSLGIQDRAKYLASLFLDDLADVIHDGVDQKFALARYGEHLIAARSTFESIARALTSSTLVDRMIDAIALETLKTHRPSIVGFTVPFSGNVYAAFRMARAVKKFRPEVKTVLGGSFVSTELRGLSEPRVFDYFDYVTLDRGEEPLLRIVDHANGGSRTGLLRTFVRVDGKVVLKQGVEGTRRSCVDDFWPTFDGLPLRRYLAVSEMLNPMHRLWSDIRWTKIMAARGCYWKKCAFCDTELDYVAGYEPLTAKQLVETISALVKETGQSGFHFVDEAAPPKVLAAMAEMLINNGPAITWWGNVRFERAFTAKLVGQLARSGCVAVTAGLESVSNRLLRLMNKGISVEQAIHVAHNFSSAGVLVHAYLIYGFPTQTAEETIDALEVVRQMFALGCLHSAYWHRFALGAHSMMAREPDKFGIRILPDAPDLFARNELAYEEKNPAIDHSRYEKGLSRAVYNYMHGVGLESDVRTWFDFRVPKTSVPATFVADLVKAR